MHFCDAPIRQLKERIVVTSQRDERYSLTGQDVGLMQFPGELSLPKVTILLVVDWKPRFQPLKFRHLNPNCLKVFFGIRGLALIAALTPSTNALICELRNSAHGRLGRRE